RFGDRILLGHTLAGSLRGVRVPDILHEAHPLLSQKTLNATDRVPLTIKKMADATQEFEVVRPVVTATAPAFHRPDLGTTAFPEAQSVRGCFRPLRRFADGPDCPWSLLPRRSAPSSIETLLWQAGFSVDALFENGGGLEHHHTAR